MGTTRRVWRNDGRETGTAGGWPARSSVRLGQRCRGRHRVGRSTQRIPVKAGLHTVGVTFLATKCAGQDLDEHLRAPLKRRVCPDLSSIRTSERWDSWTVQARRREESESHQKIFVCHPGTPRRKQRAPKDRGHAGAACLPSPRQACRYGTLMSFYQRAAASGSFDTGIERRCSASWRIRSLCSARKLSRPSWRPARAITSAIWNWRRGCRSFCGAAFPTTS